MRYYKLQEIVENPLLVYSLIAVDEDEYASIQDKTNIIPESSLPAYDYGICLSQLDGNGGIEPRPQAEVDAAKLIHDAAVKQSAIDAKFRELLAKETEIQTLTRMGEDVTDAESDFASLKSDYDAIKSS